MSNEAIVRDFFERIWNQKDLGCVAELVSDGLVFHTGGGDTLEGITAFSEAAREWFDGLPDVRVDPQEVIADGDRIAVRWHARATHTGVLFGCEPTNKVLTYQGINVFHLERDKIVEAWAAFDLSIILRAISSDG